MFRCSRARGSAEGAPGGAISRPGAIQKNAAPEKMAIFNATVRTHDSIKIYRGSRAPNEGAIAVPENVRGAHLAARGLAETSCYGCCGTHSPKARDLERHLCLRR